MKRLMVILALAVGCMLIVAALPAMAQDGGDHGSGEHSESALRGAAIYATYCQACHGPTGEAISPAFSTVVYNPDTARDVIREGSAPMPAYADVLESGDLVNLLAYMDTWDTHTTPPLPEPNLPDVPEHVPDYFGDPYEGAVVYARFCAGCHGAEGKGRSQLKAPAIELNANTLKTVAEEHAPAFGADSGGPLSETQLIDLETYMASWALHEDEPKDTGLNVLIVVMGAAAILVVGGVYLTRRDEQAPEKIV